MLKGHHATTRSHRPQVRGKTTNRHHCAAIALLVFTSLGLSAGQAERGASVAEACERGEEHLEAGTFAEAYEQFHKAFRDDPGNLEANFGLGRAAFEMGRYETAAMAFERVLIARPELDRARLELARCYFRLGSSEMARRLLQEVLDRTPPPEVRRNIESMMRAIDDRTQRSFLSGLMGVGYNWDSNARVSPGTEAIDTARGKRTISPEDRKERDAFLSTTLVLDHRLRLLDGQDCRWKTTGANYNTLYDSEDDLNLNYYTLTTGPGVEGRRFQLECRGLLGLMVEDHDRYLRSSGAAVTAAGHLSEKMWMTMETRLEDRRFYVDRRRDALNLAADVGPAIRLGASQLHSRVGFESNDARDGTESYDRWHALLRYQRGLPFDSVVFAHYRFDHLGFDRRMHDFGRTRKDRRHEFSVGVSKRLWAGLRTELSYAYVKSHSSIELYEHDRHLASFGFTLTF